MLLRSQVNEPLGPPPDPFQGWGRLDLSRSLPLEGATPPGWRLQVRWEAVGAPSGGFPQQSCPVASLASERWLPHLRTSCEAVL